MTKRTAEILVLAGLLAVLAGVVYRNSHPTVEAGPSRLPLGVIRPWTIPDPDLHVDRWVRSSGRLPAHLRDIFQFGQPPAIARPVKATAPPPVVSGPPPLEVPLTFYGLAVDPKSGRKIGFFTDGENIYVASEGDVLLGRFRLLRLGNTSAQFEELGSGRTASLPLSELK